jgi:hypothetical protein
MPPESLNSMESAPGTVLDFRRALIIALSALLALAIPTGLAFQLHVQVENGFSDFQGYYDAATIIDSGNGSHLYDLDFYNQPRLLKIMKVPGLMSRHFYIHAPFEALFFVPLARLPFATAAWVWWSFSLLCAFAAMFVMLPYLPWIRKRVELGLISVAIFVPIIATLFQGQDSLVTLLLFAICYACLVRGRYLPAGCLLAITMYKPPLALPMILLLAITSNQRWKLLAGFFATLLVLICAAIAVLGWPCVAGYPSLLSRFSTYESGHYHLSDMPNLRGLAMLSLQHFLPERIIFFVVASLSLVVLITAVWPIRKMRGKPEADPIVFSLFVTASVFVGFQEYAYDLALLYLPVLIVWNSLYMRNDNTVDRKILLYATLFLLFGSILTLTSPPIYACAILFFFIVLVRRVSLGRPRTPECVQPAEAPI